jgi:hypothetical protein
LQTVNLQKLINAGLVSYQKVEPKPAVRIYTRKHRFNGNSCGESNHKAAEMYLSQKTLRQFSKEHRISFYKLKRAAYQGAVLKPQEMAIVALYKAQKPLALICARLGANLASTNVILWRMRKLRTNSALISAKAA